MASTGIDLLAPVHRLSLEQYLRMAEVGLFDEGPRVELIDGVVVEMSPPGRGHMAAVAWLNRHVVKSLPDEVMASPQQSVYLAALRSAPEPDLAVLPAVEGLDVAAPLLVVEVSDTSLGYDRVTKAAIYARHGVGEYWIVNVRDEQLEVHREPDGEFWGHRVVARPGEMVRSTSVPDVEVDVAALFAFVRQSVDRA